MGLLKVMQSTNVTVFILYSKCRMIFNQFFASVHNKYAGTVLLGYLYVGHDI
jgi:hypothetical protein